MDNHMNVLATIIVLFVMAVLALAGWSALFGAPGWVVRLCVSVGLPLGSKLLCIPKAPSLTGSHVAQGPAKVSGGSGSLPRVMMCLSTPSHRLVMISDAIRKTDFLVIASPTFLAKISELFPNILPEKSMVIDDHVQKII